MYCLKRWLIWIYRWRHCRGFGVQSPSDYSFIRYVINEHYPYYSYEELRKEMPEVSCLKRKKAELLFRIANWKQAETIALLSDDKVYERYISRGSNKSRIKNILSDKESFVVVSALSVNDEMLSSLLNSMHDGSLLLLDDIDNVEGRMIWDKIIAENKSTITFDLYYAGIVMNINKRYKHNYIVNF